jgi:hypothetical protein
LAWWAGGQLGSTKAALTVAAVVLAAPAAADTADDQYLTTLNQLGLGCGQAITCASGDANLIEIGRKLCNLIDHYITPQGAQEMVEDYTNPPLSRDQAAALVKAAVGAYCPWDAGKLQPI